MSLYTDIQSDVFYWTNRRTMVNETDMAIRNALRKAHKAGSFYRDLQTTTVPGLSTVDPQQSIDISTNLPFYRQVYCIKQSDNSSVQYDEADIRDLLDLDGYPKYDVFWMVGTTLFVRPRAASSSVDVTYYKRPDVDNLATLSDWIATEHRDLIVLWAAATILTLVGEQEVKTRVEALAQLAYLDLISDSVEAVGR